jgi:hypothetical protein
MKNMTIAEIAALGVIAVVGTWAGMHMYSSLAASNAPTVIAQVNVPVPVQAEPGMTPEEAVVHACRTEGGVAFIDRTGRLQWCAKAPYVRSDAKMPDADVLPAPGMARRAR